MGDYVRGVKSRWVGMVCVCVGVGVGWVGVGV